MFIPQWVILLIIIAIGFYYGIKIGTPQSEYDFISPIFGFAIIVVTIVSVVSFLIGKYIF